MPHGSSPIRSVKWWRERSFMIVLRDVLIVESTPSHSTHTPVDSFSHSYPTAASGEALKTLRGMSHEAS